MRWFDLPSLRQKLCLTLVAAWVAAFGCSPSQKVDKAEQDQTDLQQAAAKDLAEAKLSLLVIDDAPLAEAIGRLRGEWQAATGGSFEVQQRTSAEVVAADRLEADAVLYPAEHLGLLAERDWLLPLDPAALKDADLSWPDVFELLRSRQAKWGSKTVAIPFGTPSLVCLYRMDLLEKLNRQPPATWTEYQELAEFFVDRAKLGDAAPSADQPWSGTLEPLAADWTGVTLLAHAAAYAQHPNHYSALFNMDTMEPLIAGPPFVRALEELVRANRATDARPQVYGPQEVCQAFLRGESALALTWPTTGHSVSDDKGAKQSSNDGKEPRWGIVALPGANQAFSPGKKTWEDRRDGAVAHVPLLGATGRLGSVSLKSSHSAAATHLLAWLSSPRWSVRICPVSAATAPFRSSHRKSAASWTPPELTSVAKDYAEILQHELNGQQALIVLNLPGRERYLAALNDAVQRTLEGKQTAAEALTIAAQQWREITESLGQKSQRLAYQRSLGLEP
jgi:ABC-type glycerol-3-phosphate transport system substrate-binding protein